MKTALAWLATGAVVALVVAGTSICAEEKDRDSKAATSQPAGEFRGDFAVDKADLVDSGENPCFSLQVGHRLTLRDGQDTLTITVLDDTKVVDGVKTRVVEERETEGGELAEVSRNFFAIHKKTGDAYYFGEEVDIYKGGKIVRHEGAWLSGEKGARFGLMMPAAPKVGDRFYQEQAPGAAMDRCEIVSLDGQRKTPAGEFKNVLCVEESSALESGKEKKWYAPGTGLLKDGGFVLVKVDKPPSPAGAAAATATTASSQPAEQK